MGKRIVATDGKDVFSEWVKNLKPNTVDIMLCMDAQLLRQREELLTEVEELEMQAEGGEGPGERSLADAATSSRLEEKRAELKALEDRIREESDTLETTCPSEDELVALGDLSDEGTDANEWYLKLVALSLKRSPAEAKELRAALPRGTWNFICLQLLVEHVQSDLSASFLLQSSGKTLTS